MEHKIHVRINGELKEGTVKSNMTLLEAIRTVFKLTGTKQGCGNGECGACTVILNGRPVRSCLILAPEAAGAEITTIEGIGNGKGGLSRLQAAFIKEGAVQCGYCTPGFIMAGESLFQKNSTPSDDSIKETLGGHICRCTGYEAIFNAFKRVRAGNRRQAGRNTMNNI